MDLNLSKERDDSGTSAPAIFHSSATPADSSAVPTSIQVHELLGRDSPSSAARSEPQFTPPALSEPSTAQFLASHAAHIPPSDPLQSLYATAEVHKVQGSFGFDVPLPSEVATADISIAPDGRFVETSSGAAARELKRRYDQYLGVGRDVRSPYAITAFVNQHGKQMYRVGHRDLSAPAASAEDAEQRASKSQSSGQISQQPHPYPQQIKRRSRMSVHSFLPASVFNKNGSTFATTTSSHDGNRSPPVRKLRKTRSIPNMSGNGSDSSSRRPAPQASLAGRPHAHSVSSADAFRPPSIAANDSGKPLQRDVFADVMSWQDLPIPPPVSSSASLSTRSLHLPRDHSSNPHDYGKVTDTIPHPFGPGVSFDAPSWRSATHIPPSPTLREMHSFESGLTARADPQLKESKSSSGVSSRQSSPDERQCADDRRSSKFSTTTTSASMNAGYTPLAETIMHSPYSTDIFDVLQTSRGLPALDKIAQSSNERTIKLSLKADESAAPRDDPRFVIWGEVESYDFDEVTPSSVTDLSSTHSGISRRRTATERSTPASKVSAGEGPKKMLVAATIERWIAQLTSELDYDELLLFFLTYRTYVSAVDLGHLLICRFHWALGEPTSSRDEMVRRIVRVRTFTAIRYWILTFFAVDFVPNRELRLLFANWLNTLRRDPILERHKDALKIVRQLRKVVTDCRDAHLRKGRGTTRHSVEQPESSGARPSVEDCGVETSRPMVQNDSEDSDIDLDFDGGEPLSEQSFGVNASAFNSLSSNPADLALLRQPLHLAFLQFGKQNPTSFQPSAVSTPILLPIPHSTFSRVLVNTIGRLGRWKRVLNSRSPGHNPLSAGVDVSAFDVEANETGDLLLVRGGVEQYLKMVENHMSQVALVRQDSREIAPAVAPRSYGQITTASISSTRPDSVINVNAGIPVETTVNAEAGSVHLSTTTNASDMSMTYRSSVSTALSDSIESPRTPTLVESKSLQPGRPLEVVSIDELDLSDLSSDEDYHLSSPPGLKKPARRLPTRRDFEFVRHSTDSVSSMGIRTHDSLMSGDSNSSAGVELGGTIHQWQMNALVESLSDEEEVGDVEAALRRLEGQISQDKQRAKQSKVDRWVQSMQDRQAAGHFGPGRSRSSSDEEDYGEVEYIQQQYSNDDYESQGSPSQGSFSHQSPRSSIESVLSPSATANWDSKTLSMMETSAPPSSDPSSATLALGSKPIAEDAVPLEILRSRLSSSLSTSPQSPKANVTSPLPSVTTAPSNRLVPREDFKWHRSFIMSYRAETLMQHFSMIDRELFLNIKFEELVSPYSMGTAEDANILDWGQFLRERARLKAEGREGHKTGSITVVRGRFNLIANFVLSEIVLTHPNERAAIYRKFISLIWIAYKTKNFNTLIAIIAGLRSEWVTKAMKQTSGRVGLREKRVLKDLTDWTSRAGHFKLIRQTVEALAEAKPIPLNTRDTSSMSTDGQSSTTRSRATSESKPPPLPACVPFFGVYLSQMHRYSSLPDLIDPTAPHEPVGIDPLSNTFETPAHPEVFSMLAPLPPSIQLEPLINVHKQRLIAGVVKSLVAGQHLASRVQYPLDKKLFQKCLKLRGLDADTLQRALALYSDTK